MNRREEEEVCKLIVGLCAAAYQRGRADKKAKTEIDAEEFRLTGGKFLLLKKMISDRLKKR